MNFHDRREETRPASGEAPFSPEEVFFSRTDKRGVIQAGNYVFRRVADFEWSDLLGAPHKIIRHPDMPRAVFWLLWDRIKKGEAIGAYVKNRARDGLYYWVFAVVAPCADGYMSARIKPTGTLRATVEEEYARLLAAETAEKLSPEESAARLLERLGTLGFEDYSLFAAHALSEELLARDEGLGVRPNPRISGFRQMLKAAADLADETTRLVHEFEAMRTVPNNMRVIASRLEPTGGAVSVLSKNYGTMSHDMSEWFATHVVGPDSNFSTIKGSVNHSMFIECMADILSECDRQLNFERRKLGDIDLENERAILRNLTRDYTRRSQRGLEQVRDEARRIRGACQIMNRHVLGLSTTRVMCKIESARLSHSGDSLTDIINQLGTFQERIARQLDRISRLSDTISTGLE